MQSEKIVYDLLEKVLTTNSKRCVCPFDIIQTNRKTYKWEIIHKRTKNAYISLVLLGIYICTLMSRLSEAYAMEAEVGFPSGIGMTAYVIFFLISFVLYLECVSKAKPIASMMQQETIFYSQLSGWNLMTYFALTF